MTIQPLKLEETTGAVHETLAGLKAKIGMLPNLYAVMAKAPTVLDSALATSGNLGDSSLGAHIGEQIAIAVGSANSCGYCVSAHSAIGKMTGVSAEDIADAQTGQASDARAQAAVSLALELNAHHGHGPNSAAAVDAARASGLTEQEILEVAGHVAINILTNTINGIADTVIDFPEVSIREAA